MHRLGGAEISETNAALYPLNASLLAENSLLPWLYKYVKVLQVSWSMLPLVIELCLAEKNAALFQMLLFFITVLHCTCLPECCTLLKHLLGYFILWKESCFAKERQLSCNSSACLPNTALSWTYTSYKSCISPVFPKHTAFLRCALSKNS